MHEPYADAPATQLMTFLGEVPCCWRLLDQRAGEDGENEKEEEKEKKEKKGE